MAKPASLQYALLALVCAAYSSYIHAFKINSESWVDLSGSVVMYAFLVAGLGACLAFLVLMAKEIAKGKSWRGALPVIPAFLLGYPLIDALNQLGQMDDKEPYLSAVVPVLAGGLIGWLVFTIKGNKQDGGEGNGI